MNIKKQDALFTEVLVEDDSIKDRVPPSQTPKINKVRPQLAKEQFVPDELLTQDETYYASRWGYTSQLHKVVTEDGYILTMYRIFKKGAPAAAAAGNPVLIGHGLFQCSGAFVLNEQDSLAFHLVNQGYDVWLGNNRSIASLDHLSLSHEDPEYWNWGLKELGMYDFPAMVDYVCSTTGFSKIAYIGHSQGNAQAFIGLSLLPKIGDKLSCFVALAPAVFSGNLVNTYPICLLINLNDWVYSLMFGKKEKLSPTQNHITLGSNMNRYFYYLGSGSFLPIMSLAQSIIEPKLFCFLAYSMFSYLFAWWDSHWLRTRKAKYFQFTPRPVSSKLIWDWIIGWGRKGVCLYIADQNNNHHLHLGQEKSQHKVPLVVFYGTHDYLVNGERFVRTFTGYETHGMSPAELAKQSSNHESKELNKNTLFPMLELTHVERLKGYEHMDTIWAHDNHKTTYPIILSNLDKAKWD
ncbi:hypothetical protein HPULCUR_008105 [Helicostylum pulchrum]|uniref:Partial AB-hydrolase lipase domain-containing protein n=1 Tax=Helicostylum pulchrum TaxID=562976 RepID=A0ABP9Y6P7_9FUNG